MDNSSSVSIPKNVIYVIAFLVAAAVVWSVYASLRSGKAEDLQEKAAQKSAEEVARSENPFQSENAFAEVESNPFEKTKEVLNPF